MIRLKKMFPRVKSLIIFGFLTLLAGAAAACPLCADNLSSDVYGKSPTSLGRGFFWSILFLLIVPFLCAGIVALKIYLAHRRGPSAS